MSTENLFSEFPSLDAAAWEKLILKELKGKDPSTIDVTLPDGSSMRPFATQTNGAVDGYRRGAKQHGNPWRIGVEAALGDADANERTLEALMGGADQIIISGDKVDALPELLKDVLLNGVDIQRIPHAALPWLLKEADRQNVGLNELSLLVYCPPAEMKA